MKLVIPSSGRNLSAPVHATFGRCTYFLFIDSETNEVDALANPFAGDERDAGVRAAQLVADRGADAVIAVMVGPHARQVLNAATIAIYDVPLPNGEAIMTHFRASRLDEA